MSKLEIVRIQPAPAPSRWSRFVDVVRSSWTGPLTSRSPELARLMGGAPSSTGIGVSEWTALNYSAFWAGVSIIAGDVASLPLDHMRRIKGGGKEHYTDSRIYRMLHDEFNPEMSSMVARETIQAHALSWGNGYAEIERDVLARPIALWPLTPDRVTPERVWDNQGQPHLVYVVKNPGGRDVQIAAADMLHIPGLGFDGLVGYSVIAKARESIAMGLAAERFGGAFFGQGSTFGGILSHPKALSDKAQQSLRNSLNSQHQGVDRAHRFVILEEGMTYEKTGIPPNDAQFLESRQFQVTEMARWFTMPPHKLGDLLHATFSNIEHQDLDYFKSCLRRWVVRTEQEYNRKLISRAERNIQLIKHNTDGFLRGDLPSRYAAYAVGRQWGWLSADDIREREDQNPLPDGQGRIYLVPMNMVPANRLGEIVDKQVEPTPEPVAPAAPEADPAVAAANERARRAEECVTEAVEAAERATAALQALEASGTATAAELAALVESERAAVATAADLAILAADADERARGINGDLDIARARIVEADSRIADEVTRTAAAETAAETERAAAAAVAADLAGITSELARVEAALAAAGVAAAEARSVEQARLTGVIGAHRALIADALGRMVRIESDRARRAQASPEKFRRWIETFYGTHEEVVYLSLLPAMRAHLAWLQSDRNPIAETRAIAVAHVAESMRELQLVLEADPGDVAESLESTLRRWDLDRAATVADRILNEEITYVRDRH